MNKMSLNFPLNIDIKTEELFEAIKDNDHEKLKKVINVANVNAIQNSLSPLSYALYKKCDTKIIRTLVNFGSYVDYGYDCGVKQVPNDLNALVIACIQYEYENFKLLVETGGNVDVKDCKGRPLLHLACRNDVQFVKLLLVNGADPNALSSEQDNALHASVSANVKFDIVNLLLKYGTNPSARNHCGISPEEHALTKRDINWPIKEVLSRFIKMKRKGSLKRKLDDISLDQHKSKLQKAEKKLKTAEHNYKSLLKKLDKAKEIRNTASESCIEIRKDISNIIDTDNSIFGQNLECPVCFEEFSPGTKIYQCELGHVICGDCSDSPSIFCCPQCRVPFPTLKKSRNRVLEDIITNVKSI